MRSACRSARLQGRVRIFTRLDHPVDQPHAACKSHLRFSLVLKGLGHTGPVADLAREIAMAMVYQTGMEPFEDTVPALDRWRARGLRLGMVSNAWPSLDRHYRTLGLRDYFEAFVISAHLGWLKPDVRIFEAALDRLDLPPDEV